MGITHNHWPSSPRPQALNGQVVAADLMCIIPSPSNLVTMLLPVCGSHCSTWAWVSSRTDGLPVIDCKASVNRLAWVLYDQKLSSRGSKKTDQPWTKHLYTALHISQSQQRTGTLHCQCLDIARKGHGLWLWALFPKTGQQVTVKFAVSEFLWGYKMQNQWLGKSTVTQSWGYPVCVLVLPLSFPVQTSWSTTNKICFSFYQDHMITVMWQKQYLWL